MYVEFGYFFHFATISLTVLCNASLSAVGQGMTSLAALDALDIQPNARPEISRTFILGMALIETSGIIGLTISLLLLTPDQANASAFAHYAEAGIALAICFAGGVIGIASSYPAQYACLSVARQPFYNQKIQGLMLLTQSLMQTPIIFAFIVALFIKGQLPLVTTLEESFRLIGAGLCIGLGSIGPSLGLARFSQEACTAVGVNPRMYQQLLSFTLMSEALIESPLIFALLISLLLLQLQVGDTPLSFIKATAFFSAALCMGLGTFGPGFNSGKISGSACKQMAITPEQYHPIARTSLFGQVLIETCAIYSMIVAFLLLFMW